MAEAKEKRYEQVAKAGTEISRLVDENQKYFQALEGTETWQAYLEFIDKIVTDGLLLAIASSIGYLLDETDATLTQGVLFEIRLELAEPDIIFRPPLDKNLQDNFFDSMSGYIEDVFHMAELIPRVARHKDQEVAKANRDAAKAAEEAAAKEKMLDDGSDAEDSEQDLTEDKSKQISKPTTTEVTTDEVPNYRRIIGNHRELRQMKDLLLTRVMDASTRATKRKTQFLEYSYLWTDSRTEYMHYFLGYGRQLTPEEIESLEEDPNAVKKQYPSLDQFKEQIDTYESLHERLKNIEPLILWQLWFRVDVKPFKTQLLNSIKRWSNVFKKHLLEHVVKSLADLNDFIDKADEGLMQQVQEGDYDGLLKVMEFLQIVKEKQSTTDTMFEPLCKIINMLRNYGVVIPEESLVQLQELPEKWANTKRLSVVAIQQVAPLQAMEVGKLKKKINDFDNKQIDFRRTFCKMRFFRFKCKRPYEYLGQTNNLIMEFEFEMQKLQESSTLFEVPVPEFKQIEQCRKEVKMLKQLWDYIFLVRTSIDEWKTTPWKDIDVENMDMECKKFSKDIRGLDKDMRSWDAFTGLELTVKNMLTSLRAVGELQNPAIRDRHWSQLVIATRVNFSMSEDTTLADLLYLNLHNFEDEVHNIVDKAIKEMAMERMLKELEVIWSSMEFLHETHARTGYTLLRTSEELIETLEENQVSSIKS